MKFIIGKKINMTQEWQGDNVIAVTRVKAEPCTVVQVKSIAKDGYEAVQIGAGVKKEKNINKPQLGHFKGLGNFRYLREFRIDNEDLKKGDRIGVSTFKPGDKISVTSTSKGKGFQGVVKRHGFRGTKKTHGNKDQLRMPGSIGAKGPAHVFKGTRMPGGMGDQRVTVTNVEVVGVNIDDNIILVKGAVPGARNSLVLISGDGKLEIQQNKDSLEDSVRPDDSPADGKQTEEENKNAKTEEVKEPPAREGKGDDAKKRSPEDNLSSANERLPETADQKDKK